MQYCVAIGDRAQPIRGDNFFPVHISLTTSTAPEETTAHSDVTCIENAAVRAYAALQLDNRCTLSLHLLPRKFSHCIQLHLQTTHKRFRSIRKHYHTLSRHY